jgi:hypothetical protein
MIISFIAYALRTCLSRNTYAQEKCAEHMRNLYECCQALYDAMVTEEGRGESTACQRSPKVPSKFSQGPYAVLARRWMPRRDRKRIIKVLVYCSC